MPDLYLATESNDKVLPSWRECEGSDGRIEREVVDRDSPGNYGEDSSTVFVNGEKEISLWIEIDATDVLAVGKGECVARDPARSAQIIWPKCDRALYRVKLKTDTRFPTGDNRESPPGVKTRLPLP